MLVMKQVLVLETILEEARGGGWNTGNTRLVLDGT
jgi:hypothetical protein